MSEPARAPAPTVELFRDDAHARACEATVIGAAETIVAGKDGFTDSGLGVRLDRTVFYPMGGGQPGDTGVLRMADGRTIRVINTIKAPSDGAPLHVLEPGAPVPQPGAPVTAEIDWDRRHRHMRMHSLLHVLCSIVPGAVTGGSVSADRGRLDFDLGVSKPDKDALSAELNRLIAEDRPLAIRLISDAELAAKPELVRTMKVKPPGGTGSVRLIEIEGVDLQPCGGTHVRSTAEIGRVRIAKIESKGRQNRRITVVFDEG